MWVRPRSLNADKIDRYKQVVGHTEMNSILEKDDVYFIDCLSKGDYLKFNKGKCEMENIF